MKKITSKVILLAMIIPLIMIFIMGSTINMTAIMVDIPVTNIEIEGDEIIFVDITSKDNSVKLNTIITPAEATDKTVTYTTKPINGEKEALVDISKDGLVTPKSTGSIRVIATASGGRQDSVQINFYSSKVSEVEQVIYNLSVGVGEDITLTSGTHFNVLPRGAIANITYYSDSSKVKVDRYTGKITGLFTGEVEVIAKIQGVKYDEISKKFIDTTHEIKFLVTIERTNDEKEFFNFAGGSNTKEEIVYLDTKSVPFEYLGFQELGKLSYEIDENDAQYIQSVGFEYLNDSLGNMDIILTNDAPKKDYIFTIKAGGVELGTLKLKKQDPKVQISVSQTTYNVFTTNIVFGSTVEGLDGGYSLRYESSDSSVLDVNTRNYECKATAIKEGTALVKVKLYINGVEIAVSEAVEFTIVNSYISIGLVENSNTYGLEDRFVLGKYDYNTITELAQYQLNLKASNTSGAVENIDSSKVKWSSSDTSIATVDGNGVVKVLKDGVVNITVESVYNQVLFDNVKASFEITCKDNGVNVYDFQDLVWANSNNYEMVLMNDVMLADQINENNYRSYLNEVTHLMNTTADKAYYEDNNKSEDAKVRYCFEFISNVYGNGFAINGNNITRSIDAYNYSVFNGPLNLLALSYDNNSSSNARIKSQDNIVFLVRKSGISINNIELKGCSDSSLIESGQTNLARLNNVGTVLEIVGDDVNLSYSRINNGRTVLRIYGSAHEEDNNKLQNNIDNYKIEATITNCILSYAREFILKVGSNQLLRNESVIGEDLEMPSVNPEKYEHAAPSFKKENGDNYSQTGSKDQYFVDNYLMTDIILKDSVFYGAGLFCVGFESQFAGLALHGYDYGNYKFSELGWKSIAGTSYPARIRMQGEVRFYDWKEISKVDSSTLVEGDQNILQTVGLDLDVSNLLNKYNDQNPNNKIIDVCDGKKYINGAIVFYGGGKNYSWVDTSEVGNNFNPLVSFEIPLSYFGSRESLIYYAAGKENFRFMTYNNEGSINYTSQQKDLDNHNAYTWLMRK